MVPNRLSTQQCTAVFCVCVCVMASHAECVCVWRSMFALSLNRSLPTLYLHVDRPRASLHSLPVLSLFVGPCSSVCGPALNGRHISPHRVWWGKMTFNIPGLLPQSILMLVYQTCSLAWRTTPPMFPGPWGAISDVGLSTANCKAGNSKTHRQHSICLHLNS